MSDKEDYLTPYRVFFENFAATVNPEDQLPVNIAGYTITESELIGEVLYWITQYLTEKQCPLTLMTPLRRIILEEVRVASKKYPNDFGFKSEESVYIALRLMQAVTARVNDVCLRYLDNSRLDTLPPPPPLAQRDLKTVSCATKNSRRVMEDRHVEIGNLEALFGIETTEPTSFYAVYDGHAGSAAATYCAAHLHQYLVESPHFTTDLTRAMRDAFLRTDAEFIRKSNQERACGGSTAVVVTIRGRKLLAAWAGDSLAFLAKRMRLMQLVRPHKPSRQDERERIEKSGGTVMYWGTWRVNGQLAVSRAIGDAQYKPYVTAKPEHATVDLDGDEDFVVVACDGLWDFVSEDDVALSVYRQIGADPDDLKAVTKRLIAQAKRQGSADNISIIVVFLKDPRDIAAENRPPMDLGLDNALANAPPFASETEACKRPADAAAAAAAVAADADAEPDTDANADNGVDNSDSDSEDLGPETAVDADDIDADARNHEPAPPTPPAHAVEEGHVVGALVDNVAESGDESEDEWNYFKGEGEREENPSEEPDEAPRSETPCQDNSAWETSSVDMNSSPLNPDAPVFIPGSVGSDVLLAESPRKPLPMDDIELPDVAQFETEAVVRPAELLDLDNCDQLNGHHNASKDLKEHLNGNGNEKMDSLGFGFNVGIEPDKVKDSSLIQDFERIQKDTTDFCNIQVFQTHTETNPFAETFESNDELFERLKNKERDPMSMSFYQEKDDDTCERLTRKELHVDLNAVQPLPDSDDEDLQTNGISENDNEKENISPDHHIDLFGSQDSQEPNNDIMRFDDRTDNLLNNIASFGQVDNSNDNSATNNVQPFSNIDFESNNIPQDTIMQTDTPESHKLLFEQIPEIPDGKSSELGFTNDDLLDPESERDDRIVTPQEEPSQLSQDTDDSKRGESPAVKPEEINMEIEQGITQVDQDQIANFEDDNQNEKLEVEPTLEAKQASFEQLPISPAPDKSEAITPEPTHETEQADILVHENAEQSDHIEETVEQKIELEIEAPQIQFENERLSPEAETDLRADSPVPPRSPFESVSPAPHEIELPSESPIPSPLPTEPSLPIASPLPTEAIASPIPTDASLPRDSPLPIEICDSPLPTESPLPQEAMTAESPMPVKTPLPTEPEAEFIRESPLPSESPLPQEVSLPTESPVPVESHVPVESPLPVESPVPAEPIESQASRTPAPEEIQEPIASPVPIEEVQLLETVVEPTPEVAASPVPVEIAASPVPVEIAASPVPVDIAASPVPVEIAASPVPLEVAASPVPEIAASPVPVETPADQAIEIPVESVAPVASPLPVERAPTPAAEPTVDAPIELATEAPLTAAEQLSAPAPDLLSEAELVTDLDVGVPESRAQEICVPVTSEIRPEDGERPAGAATPPPTPAVQPLAAAPLAAATALAAGAAVAAAAAAKKTPAAKKPSTPTTKTDARTPKSTPKAAAPRTPASATKRPATAPAARTPSAPRPAPARTSATKPAAPKPAAPVKTPPPIRAPSKVAAAAAAAAAKPASAPAPAAAKPAPKPAAPAAPRAAPAPRIASAPKPPAARLSAPKPPAAKTAAPTRPVAARSAPTAARPAPRPAPAPARKAPEKKPLSNGDVKECKPAPISRAGAAARAPAPRPAPRAAAPPPPATTRSAAPKPATRASPLDKQSKDLANKRITAKAAPPRTAATKVTSTKTAVNKVSCRKAGAALSNGAGEPAKPPPTPPAQDNATLPDVIA